MLVQFSPLAHFQPVFVGASQAIIAPTNRWYSFSPVPLLELDATGSISGRKMAETITLTLEPRTVLGKKVRALRREGIIPVHLYGRGVESQPLQCDGKILLRALATAGMNLPISVTIPGQKDQELAFARDIQWDSVRGEMLHVDFLRVDVSLVVTASVPIILTGTAPAGRLADGTVVQPLRNLDVQALPLDMPSDLTVDLEKIAKLDDVIRASDIILPPNVTIITDAEETVARYQIVREEVSEVPISEQDELPGPGETTPTEEAT